MSFAVRSAFFLLAVASPMVVEATQTRTQAKTQEAAMGRANPIRKVVNMLTAMQKKVTKDGEEEEKLHDKKMCACKTNEAQLTKNIADYESKIPQTSSDLEEGKAKLAQTKEALAGHKADLAAAEASMKEATSVRDTEAVEYAKASKELKANIAAAEKAVVAISKGMSASFLQTRTAEVLRNLMQSKLDMDDSDRETVTAFLQGQSDEDSPEGNEVVGILKTMIDEMKKDLSEATEAEESAISSYEAAMAAKKKEAAALQKGIETKIVHVGDLSVEIVENKNALANLEKSLAEDTEFLSALQADCSKAEKKYDAEAKTRAEEVVALADTIKILNDDDALDLFKKTLPSGSASFIQLQETAGAMRARALDVIRSSRRGAKAGNVHLDFIALALHGKKVGFGQVIQMIDDMSTTLKTEQADDDKKVTYCNSELKTSADTLSDLKRDLKDIETAIAEKEEHISTLAEEIAALGESISALDASVAEATAQRKAENKLHTQLTIDNSNAKELLGLAKNRMQKFYNPKLAKASLLQNDYAVRKEDSSGVLAMIDMLIADLDKEIAMIKTEEKDAQEDYEVLMADSKEKRSTDSKALAAKEATKADMEAAMQTLKGDHSAKAKELVAEGKYNAAVHADCDWLLKYYDVRKEARGNEIDALSKAKSVLSGADYSLVQTNTHHRVIRRATFLERA
mmetsp:Transcript_161085/g.297057  ORF Transcript_161085/g.297057 Transcript_161085/m.297057 type:complete len:686 (-) Transcript_161085:50-2107(-)